MEKKPSIDELISDYGRAIYMNAQDSTAETNEKAFISRFALEDAILDHAKQAARVEPVAEVKLMERGGNAGIATVINEIYSPYRETLRPGTKLYTTPPATAALVEAAEKAIQEMSRGRVACEWAGNNADAGKIGAAMDKLRAALEAEKKGQV